MNPPAPYRLFLAYLLFVALPSAAAMAQDGPQEGHSGSEHQGHREEGEGMHHEGAVEHSFADAEAWAERFEGPERDAWQQPEKVVEALELKPGMTVADIGSGTGYFSRRFASAVGPGGTVFAADVEPEMGVYVRQRADEDGQTHLIPVLASYDDPRLPAGAVDLVFVCNTWHHIQDRVEYAKRLAGDLKPGGQVAILDFVEGYLPVGPATDHKLSAEDVTEEFRAAGYRLVGTFDQLSYQYLLIFEPNGGAD